MNPTSGSNSESSHIYPYPAPPSSQSSSYPPPPSQHLRPSYPYVVDRPLITSPTGSGAHSNAGPSSYTPEYPTDTHSIFPSDPEPYAQHHPRSNSNPHLPIPNPPLVSSYQRISPIPITQHSIPPPLHNSVKRPYSATSDAEAGPSRHTAAVIIHGVAEDDELEDEDEAHGGYPNTGQCMGGIGGGPQAGSGTMADGMRHRDEMAGGEDKGDDDGEELILNQASNRLAFKRPCDVCRKRKIKCVPSEQDSANNLPSPSTFTADLLSHPLKLKHPIRCRGCLNLGVTCTWTYVNKKPGRPLGSTRKPKLEPGQEEGTSAAMGAARNGEMGAPGMPSGMQGSRERAMTLPDGSGGGAANSTQGNPSGGMIGYIVGEPRSAGVVPPSGIARSFAQQRNTIESPTSPLRPTSSHVYPSDQAGPSKPSYAQNDPRGQRSEPRAYLMPSTASPDQPSQRPVTASGPTGAFGHTSGQHYSPGQGSGSASQSYPTPQSTGMGPEPYDPPSLNFHLGPEQWFDNSRQNSVVATPTPGYGQTPIDVRHGAFWENVKEDDDNDDAEARRKRRKLTGTSVDGGSDAKPRRSSMSLDNLVGGEVKPSNSQERRSGDSSFVNNWLSGRSGRAPTEEDDKKAFQPPQQGLDNPRAASVGMQQDDKKHFNTPPHEQSHSSYAPMHRGSMNSNISGLMPEPAGRNGQAGTKMLQLEDVTSFSNISYFISLYLRYQHALVPIVHKPTFNADLAMRRDKMDHEFRALLLSLVAYVICQVPKSKMSDFGQSDLEALQAKCHNASRTIQEQVRKTKAKSREDPTLVTLAALIADYFYHIATCDAKNSATTLGEAARLAYVLRLHTPNTQSQDGTEQYDYVQMELRKRIFWQLYNTDKTDSCSGLPIMMHDFEGVPGLPMTVDDELVTSYGYLPQPPDRPSYMAGFVALISIFRILAQVQTRSRMYAHSSGEGLDGLEMNRTIVLDWIQGAQQRIEDILEDLPEPLRSSTIDLSAVQSGDDRDDIFSVQRANLLITAVSVHFELLNFKALASPGVEISRERELQGRRAYNLLASIPLDHLAANGEAMRGKVLRIIISLLGTTVSTVWNQDVRDWWDMYGNVQFVQVIPMNPEMLLERRNSQANLLGGF